MKKRVLLYLVMIVSLAAIAYSAAVTNPGHGVEEIGSGSSPYAAFRDWNVLEAGYEDQYSGPTALKSNVFWLGTLNAETIAAQNSSADWCAIQIHPSGIYMNCFNNASNMTLYNSYYWNGTNFTKNDTIKNGTNTIEKKVLQIGGNGGQELFEITGNDGNTAGYSVRSDGSVTQSLIQVDNTPTATGATVQALLDGGNGVATMTGQNINGVTVTSVSSDGGTGTTTISSTDGAETGTTEVGPGTVTTTGTDGAGTGNTGGEIGVGQNIDMSVSTGGITKLINTILSATPTGGQSETEILDNTGGTTLFTEILGTTVLGGTLVQNVYELTTGTSVVGTSANTDVNGNGVFSLTTTETAAGVGAQGTFTMDFDALGNAKSEWSMQNSIAADTTSIAQNTLFDTITITAGSTEDENGFDFEVLVSGPFEIVDPGVGFTAPMPAGATFCTLAGTYLNAPGCFLHDFSAGVIIPGLITGSFTDSAGVGCPGTVAVVCQATT